MLVRKPMKRQLFFLILIPLALISFSCKKKNTQTSFQPNVNASTDYVVSENTYIDVFNIYFKSIINSDVAAGQVVTIDGATVEYMQEEGALFIDYGPEPVTCEDGCTRSGLIKINFNGDWFEEGTTGTFRLDALFVDYNLVEGDLVSDFLGASTGKERFTYDIRNGFIRTITSEDTSFTLYTSDYIISWEEGSSTPSDPTDDLLLVSGSTSGTSSDNVAFSVTITNPLRNYLDCNWIVSGINTITVPAGEVQEGTIDYVTEDSCNFLVNFYFDDNYFYHHLK
jgi:hypothetical protein